jgi:hypothetical protein
MGADAIGSRIALWSETSGASGSEVSSAGGSGTTAAGPNRVEQPAVAAASSRAQAVARAAPDGRAERLQGRVGLDLDRQVGGRVGQDRAPVLVAGGDLVELQAGRAEPVEHVSSRKGGEPAGRPQAEAGQRGAHGVGRVGVQAADGERGQELGARPGRDHQRAAATVAGHRLLGRERGRTGAVGDTDPHDRTAQVGERAVDQCEDLLGERTVATV